MPRETNFTTGGTDALQASGGLEASNGGEGSGGVAGGVDGSGGDTFAETSGGGSIGTGSGGAGPGVGDIDGTGGQPSGDTFASPKSVALALAQTCLIDPEDKVHCWGRDVKSSGDARNMVPDYLADEKVTTVAVSHTANCVILAEPFDSKQAIRCWGLHANGRALPNIESPIALSGGNQFFCALRADGGVQCHHFLSPVHSAPQALRAKAIAGYGYSCAIKLDNTVSCWGEGAQQPPANLQAKHLAISGVFPERQQHSCAIDLEDNLFCWGENKVAITVPESAKKVLDVAVGHRLTCVLLMNGKPLCWGDTSGDDAENIAFVLDDVPDNSTFARIFVGHHSAIAVRADGSFHLWGESNGNRNIAPVAMIRVP